MSTMNNTLAERTMNSMMARNIRIKEPNIVALGITQDIVSERPPSMHDSVNLEATHNPNYSPIKKLTLKKLSMTPKPDKALNKGWLLQQALVV